MHQHAWNTRELTDTLRPPIIMMPHLHCDSESACPSPLPSLHHCSTVALLLLRSKHDGLDIRLLGVIRHMAATVTQTKLSLNLSATCVPAQLACSPCHMLHISEIMMAHGGRLRLPASGCSYCVMSRSLTRSDSQATGPSSR